MLIAQAAKIRSSGKRVVRKVLDTIDDLRETPIKSWPEVPEKVVCHSCEHAHIHNLQHV